MSCLGQRTQGQALPVCNSHSCSASQHRLRPFRSACSRPVAPATRSQAFGQYISRTGSFLGKALPLAPAARVRAAKHRQINASSSSNDVQLADRLVASIVYLIPLMDGLRYGRFFFQQFPITVTLLQPIFPLFRLYTSIPLASLVVFYGIYAGIINNQSFSRYVRFNAMQAVLLSIILILASVLLQIYPKGTLSSQLGQSIFVNLNNAVWLYIAVCVAYAVGSCLTGAVARLPLVSNAAEQRVP